MSCHNTTYDHFSHYDIIKCWHNMPDTSSTCRAIYRFETFGRHVIRRHCQLSMPNAPASSDIRTRGSAHAVNSNLLYLSAMVDTEKDNDTTTYGEAYAATSDSESSAEKLH